MIVFVNIEWFVDFWLPGIWFFEQPCRKFPQPQSQNSNWNRLSLLNKGLQFQKGFDRFFRGNSRVISDCRKALPGCRVYWHNVFNFRRRVVTYSEGKHSTLELDLSLLSRSYKNILINSNNVTCEQKFLKNKFTQEKPMHFPKTSVKLTIYEKFD